MKAYVIKTSLHLEGMPDFIVYSLKELMELQPTLQSIYGIDITNSEVEEIEIKEYP